MNRDAVYCVWLQYALGFSHQYTARVRELYGSVASFYHGGQREWRLSGLFQNRQLDKLAGTSLSLAEETIEQCGRLHIRIMVESDEEYPSRLSNIGDPPPVLYIRGQWPQIDEELCVAMVGTRKASPYGLNAARKFSSEIAEAGGIVVSGGALGVDTASHQGALQAGGRTIAVLGCGMECEYLPQNKKLREQICERGALVTEYPPHTQPMSYYFPVRNRIISGLSLGTLVIEAGDKSGSLITANLALEQGRDVFAVPGNIYSLNSSGTNTLIKNGAKPVTKVLDILEEYCQIYADKLLLKNAEPFAQQSSTISPATVNGLLGEKKSNKKEGTYCSATANNGAKDYLSLQERALPDLPEKTMALYSRLGEKPQHIDELSIQAGLSVGEALAALTELELLGLIQAEAGKRYALKKI